MRRNILDFLIPVIVAALYIFQLTQINKNLDSIFDEGFLFLKIQAAQNGNIDGSSQWAVLVNSIFGKHVSSNLLYLRYMRYFFHLWSVTMFAIVTAWYLIKSKLLENRQKTVQYISFVYLFGTVSLGGTVLSYNNLQEFFLLAVILSFLLATVTKSTIKPLFYTSIGVFSFFSIMTILPSGILIFLFILILIWIKDFKSWKLNLQNTVWVLLGVLIAALIFNFFIVDLYSVYLKMSETVQTITMLKRGYDPISFIYNILFYFRDFYIHICTLLGLMIVCVLILKFSKRWVAYVVFFLSLIILSVYLRKPDIPVSTLIGFPIIGIFVAILFEIPGIPLKNILSFNILLILFLFFSPLISSIGTNTPLANKMVAFILPWSLVFAKMMNVELIKKKYSKEICFLYYLIFLIIAVPQVLSIASSIKNSSNPEYYFKSEKPISSIVLNEKQKKYFDNVYHIILEYNYKPKDFVFATQLDHMTIVAFSATPCGIYFQPTDYIADPNKNTLNKPDFLFLTEYDLSVISDTLRYQNWGFPGDYDQFFVGTPETRKTDYPTERTLYCRKDRKLIQ